MTNLLRTSMAVVRPTWVGEPVDGLVLVQSSAHGATRAATIEPDGAAYVVTWTEPQRRIAPGQSVVFYDLADRCVLGGGIARPRRPVLTSSFSRRAAGVQLLPTAPTPVGSG